MEHIKFVNAKSFLISALDWAEGRFTSLMVYLRENTSQVPTEYETGGEASVLIQGVSFLNPKASKCNGIVDVEHGIHGSC
jgi:hypothetical protein